MTDRIILAGILVLAAVYFWATSHIPTLEIGDPLGPKAFPRLLGVGLLITAAMLLAEILRDQKAKKPAAAAETAPGSGYGVVALAVVATAIFFVSFESLGYVASVAAYLLVMMNYFNKRGRWLINSLTAVVYSVASYYIFTKALGVNLPQGVLRF